jgi:hypothetical protein
MKKYFVVFGLVALALSTPLFMGCRKTPVETMKNATIPPIKKIKEETQYIIQVDKDGQILSSREYTEQAAKPLPDAERVIYIDAISKEEAAKKAEVHVHRIMAQKAVVEMNALRDTAIAKAKAMATKASQNKITITITINR